MSTTKPTGTTAGPTIELHSIDYVPPPSGTEAVAPGTFWFTGEFVLPSMLAGFIGPSFGLSAWSRAAVVLGAWFGTVFMGFTRTRVRGWACRR